MKTTLATLALGVLVAAAQPAEAQTLTYGTKSVHRRSTLSHRAATQKRIQRSHSRRVQSTLAKRQRTRQSRALKQMRNRASERPRYSVKSAQTPGRTKYVINRNRKRTRDLTPPKQVRPGVRITQRRIATEAEMRGLQGRPTPKQRAARAGRVVY